MDILNTLFYFFIALGILVTVHELGHFLSAKLFGMRIEKFYIGFDFFKARLWRKTIGETEYGIGLIPLGGYVKIAGMVDESLDTTFEGTEPKPWEYRAKPVWQRLIVLAGGVAMNMLLAVVIFIGLALYSGEQRTSIENPAFVSSGSPFDTIGIKTGDRFVALNGRQFAKWEEVIDPLTYTESSMSYRFTILRDGKQMTIHAPENLFSMITRYNGFGIRPMNPPLIDSVVSGMPAAKAGIQPGGLITAINGKPISDWLQVTQMVSANTGKPITISILYPAEPSAIPDPERIKRTGTITKLTMIPDGSGKIGVSLKRSSKIERKKLPTGAAILTGINQTGKMTKLTLVGFWQVVSGKESARKSLGGPIKIAELAGESAKAGMSEYFSLIGLLSISLAFLNILPIPALDGGQLVLTAVEGIIGKELPISLKLKIQQIGMLLLAILFFYVMINDLLNL